MPLITILALVAGSAAGVPPAQQDSLRASSHSGASAWVSGDSASRTISTNGPVAVPVAVRRLTDAILMAGVDTPTTRRRATEVSDWYQRRLIVHRVTAFVIPALFVYQYSLGSKLFDESSGGDAAPRGTRSAHRRNATIIAAAFGVNAITGGWNYWDSRSVADGRTRRTVHALSMLAAMGGFTYAGVKLAHDAKTATTYDAAQEKRRQHRTVALASMGVTVVSGVSMWILNR